MMVLQRRALFTIATTTLVSFGAVAADLDTTEVPYGANATSSITVTRSLQLQPGLLFPGRGGDVPFQAYWKASNNHYDMHMVRFDQDTQSWTKYRDGATREKDRLDDHLVYYTPIFASADGEVVTCWRNAPENPIGKPHQGRDGCGDKDKDGNLCEHYETCSCTIPRPGNHLNILNPDDGTISLYAHLIPNTIPKEICPHNDQFVENANYKDPSLGAGHNPDAFVPVGSRPTVQKGQFLGNVGHSGASSMPHLHHHRKLYDSAKIAISYNDGEWQTFPGGSTNVDPNLWSPLDGQTPLLVSSSEPDKLVRPPWGPTSSYAYVRTSESDSTHTALSQYTSDAGMAYIISYLSTGEYIVNFPSIGTRWPGNMQVTAYGKGNRRCKIVSQTAVFGGVAVRVNCHRPNGNLVNSKFVASFKRFRSPNAQPGEAYLTTAGLGSQEIPILDQHNSMGAPNRVRRSSTGVYVVTMPGQSSMPNSGGTIQVTAVGTDSDYCKIRSWGSTSGKDIDANVRCFDTNGDASNSRFSLYYSVKKAAGGESGGYAWADNHQSSEYTPDESYAYFEGTEISTSTTAWRTGTGRYRMRFPALGDNGSSALVTAHGSNSNYCKVQSWASSGANAEVKVRCFNASGNPVNSQFVVNYATTSN